MIKSIKLRNISSLLSNVFHQYTNKNNHRQIQHLIKNYEPDKLTANEITLDKLKALEEYAKYRKSVNNISEIRNILQSLQTDTLTNLDREELILKLYKELSRLPNKTHPIVLGYGNEPKELKKFNQFPNFETKPKEFDELTKKMNIFRMENLGNYTGHKSYYFTGVLAEMEHALIQYSLKHLRNNQFQLISVPDILPAEIIEGCGMQASGIRTQVYKLTESGKCLSGTSEMALAGYFKNKILNEKDLPIKVCAVSRCFRAETSALHEEKGVYRVHQFTKVEMFSICSEDQSEKLLDQFKDIEIEIFEKLGIHFKLLDMPANELGAPAYRKYDIEAWMPGRNMWGEISSCSNCTDYQAKRLNIQYRGVDNKMRFAHTINGTACAVPRLLIALLETYQKENNTIAIPSVLQPLMGGLLEIKRESRLPALKFVKFIDSTK